MKLIKIMLLLFASLAYGCATKMNIDIKHASIYEVPFKCVNSYEEIPENKKDLSPVSFSEFNLTRNLLVASLNKFGKVGPIQEVLLSSSDEEDPDYLIQKDKTEIYIVDDQLYEEYRYHEIELPSNDVITPELLDVIWRALWSYPTWGVKIKTEDVYYYLEIDGIYAFSEVNKIKKECQESLEKFINQNQ